MNPIPPLLYPVLVVVDDRLVEGNIIGRTLEENPRADIKLFDGRIILNVPAENIRSMRGYEFEGRMECVDKQLYKLETKVGE